MTFEESLKQLEEIAVRLEKGECTLDESISLYVKAMALSKECTAALEKAKLKISKLSDIEEKVD
ncbi:MAG: exodeoxyribonuclease VII small subunit [Acutalibacteraceae bacterium]|nr:exodeoxyribonuclease VII small subunit [Acutalibacteraceae bacterium]